MPPPISSTPPRSRPTSPPTPARAAWCSTSTTAAPTGGAQRRAPRLQNLRAAREPKNAKASESPEALRVPLRTRVWICRSGARRTPDARPVRQTSFSTAVRSSGDTYRLLYKRQTIIKSSVESVGWMPLPMSYTGGRCCLREHTLDPRRPRTVAAIRAPSIVHRRTQQAPANREARGGDRTISDKFTKATPHYASFSPRCSTPGTVYTGRASPLHLTEVSVIHRAELSPTSGSHGA